MPELTSQSMTASTLDWAGAKYSVTSSEVICFPKWADPGVDLYTYINAVLQKGFS